ncbi:hypothetical protein ACWEQC_22050 [Streptomyces shenzhenensis]
MIDQSADAIPEGLIATRVCIDGPDTYPAFIDPTETFGSRVVPYFTLDTVRQLAHDTQAGAAKHDPRGAAAIHIVETTPDRNGEPGRVVLHIDWWQEANVGPEDAVLVVAPNEHGLYPIGRENWHWSVAWWRCACGTANEWHVSQCSGCHLTRTAQPDKPTPCDCGCNPELGAYGEYDTTSSASRQHFVDTGRFLRHTDRTS